MRAQRFALVKPANAPFEYFDSLAPSPDGSLIAFVAHSSDEKRSLWVRPVDSLEGRALPGTEDVQYPFWSPDSRFIGFFAGGKLKKIDSRSGPAENLCDAPEPFGGSWGSRGVIVFEGKDLGGISKVSAEGGSVTPVTSLAPGDEAHRWPVFLPDGDHFIFLVDANKTEGHWIGLSSITSGRIAHLAHAISNFAFSSTGHLIFVKSGSLVAQRFDPKSLHLSGNPVPIGDNPVEIAPNHRFDFGVSASGLLVYLSADPKQQFVWFDRSGKRLGTAGEPGRYRFFELSPDDGRVAFEKLDNDGRNGNLWTLDLTRGFTTRLTTDAASDWSPLWTPDGRSIIFGSSRSGLGDFYETSSAGGDDDRMVLKCPTGDYAYSISPDGRNLIYSVYGDGTKEDLWLLPLDGSPKPRPFRATPFAESSAQFSPDGRWVAFAADDSGRSEVYVRSVADPSEQSRISAGGGVRPRWRRDGKELFFFSGGRLMAASVSESPAFRAGEPRALFAARIWGDYAVSKDGQRFLISTSPSETAEPTAIAVLNWTSAIKE